LIVAKTFAAAFMTAAAGMRAGGKPRTSDNKENRKYSRGVTQHWRDLFEILLAFVSIQRPLSIGFLHKSFGKRLKSSNTQCNRLPDIAAFRSSSRPFGRTKMQSLGRQPAASPYHSQP
jgi:hypothetical protein